MSQEEELHGFVMDVACLRRCPQEELVQRAREHTRECALEGHCVESGYALIDANGRVAVLDAEATPKIAEVVRASRRGDGIRLRVKRSTHEGRMRTLNVDLLE